jgi:hypothetical protein
MLLVRGSVLKSFIDFSSPHREQTLSPRRTRSAASCSARRSTA